MIKWLWRIGVFLICINSFAQKPFTKQIWIGDMDIPVNVHDVFYQKNGYLWLATDEGLMYYNGRDFSKINDSLNGSCLQVTVCNQKVLAAFTNGLIAQLEASTMTLQPVCPQLIAGITCITPFQKNVILIGTKDRGVLLLINGQLLQLNKAATFRLTDDFVNDIKIIDDKVFVATDKGVNIFSYTNKKWKRHTLLKKDGLPDNIITCVASFQKDTLCWIGTQQSGIVLYHLAKKQILPQSVQHEWPYGQINDILPVSLQKAWAVTEAGYLLELAYQKGTMITKAYSLNVKLKNLIKDKTGNIWCATHTGLLMHTGLYLKNLPLPSSFRTADITALTADSAGNLWFSQKEKLFRINTVYPSKPVLIETLPAAITTLYYTPENTLWIGSFGEGLFNYDNKKLQKLNIPVLNKGHIISISKAFNKLWVASLNGLFALPLETLSAGEPQIYTKKDGVGSDYIYQLSTGSQGNLWMATDGGGITQYDGNAFIQWDHPSGQKSNVFYSIHAATKNKVWANSLDNGLYRFDGKSWKNYNTAHGLQDLAIHAIAQHGKDGLIVVNKKGIDQWSEKTKQFRQYNRRLGWGIDSISSVLNCITTDEKGNVYVPYHKGFLRFEHKESGNIQPDISIRKMSLFFKNIAFGKHHFAHNENHLSFAFEGINFTQPEPPQYRYKLTGYDNNWVYTENETVSFAQLNPGEYTFTVQASLSNNFVNPSESQYSFSIEKPFWQTGWFIVLSACFISGMLYAFIKWRERNIMKANQMQKQRLIYEYEHLKTQVNPHFLFNSFNTLVNIIEEDKEEAIHYTEHLSDLYRNMLSYKDVDLISLKEEYEILQSYIHIQKSRFGAALKIHESINPLYLKTKKIVPLSLQILLENAVKHNIVSLTHPLHIYIVTEEDTITIRNNLQPKMSKEKGQGIGLENIYKRYRLLTNRTLFYGIKNNEYLVILPLI